MLIISPEGPHKSEKVSEKVAGGLQHKLLQGDCLGKSIQNYIYMMLTFKLAVAVWEK